MIAEFSNIEPYFGGKEVRHSSRSKKDFSISGNL